MVIHKIQMDGFGKFCNKTIEFGEGIQVIYGENEAGKSTCKQFIVSMLYDIERLRGKGAKTDEYHRYEPKYGGSYGGMMDFFIGDTSYQLQRNFQRDKQEFILYEKEKGTLLPIEQPLHEYFSFLNREQFLNTLCIQGGQIPVGNKLKEELNHYSQQVASNGSMEFDVEIAIQSLNAKKQTRYIKEKERELLDIKLQLEQYKQVDIQHNLLEEEAQIELKINKLKESLNEIEQKEREIQEIKSINRIKRKKPKINLGVLVALVCSMFVFFLVFQNPIIVGITGVLGCLIGIFILIFKKNLEKNLPDTRSVVQLEKILLYQKEREVYFSQIATCEKELLQNRMAQKYEKEKDHHKQEIEEKYQQIRQDIHKAEKKNKAIELAISTLRNVSTSIYNEFSNSLNEELSSMIRYITNDRCQRVFLDEKLGIQVEQNGKFFGIEQLSLGMVEQVYFAIRMVAGKLLGREESLPFLLDDIFGNFDDGRLRRILRLLSQSHQPQIFIFTCNKRVLDILYEEQINFSYIEL